MYSEHTKQTQRRSFSYIKYWTNNLYTTQNKLRISLGRKHWTTSFFALDLHRQIGQYLLHFDVRFEMFLAVMLTAFQHSRSTGTSVYSANEVVR